MTTLKTPQQLGVLRLLWMTRTDRRKPLISPKSQEFANLYIQGYSIQEIADSMVVTEIFVEGVLLRVQRMFQNSQPKLTIRTTVLKDGKIELADFADILDVDSVEFYSLEMLPNGIAVTFYDKDKNVIELRG
jgi:predicted DNA-binding protein YlxM (UPF0122 family)